ncbi:MAG: class I SAM-dependent methyltransferase [Burkholderiales bacterium]
MEHFRDSPLEQARIADLFGLIPERGARALDVGARDGFLSLRLAERYDSVVALDLEKPQIDHPRIECVAANAAALPYADDSFDLVLCSEVLEHIPRPAMDAACREIVRVASGPIVIGVPLQQDLRIAETTCSHCGHHNPPWGHVNSFTEHELGRLFSPAFPVRQNFVGTSRDRTCALAVDLLRYAGNPFGTYLQDETCLSCDQPIGQPGSRTLPQRIATRCATLLNSLLSATMAERPMWIHVLYSKSAADSAGKA